MEKTNATLESDLHTLRESEEHTRPRSQTVGSAGLPDYAPVGAAMAVTSEEAPQRGSLEDINARMAL